MKQTFLSVAELPRLPSLMMRSTRMTLVPPPLKASLDLPSTLTSCTVAMRLSGRRANPTPNACYNIVDDRFECVKGEQLV